MTPQLKAFFEDWLANKATRYTRSGLCHSLELFSHDHELDFYLLMRELRSLLREDFGTTISYPFCTEGEYVEMFDNSTQHQLQSRIDWVEAKLEAAKV